MQNKVEIKWANRVIILAATALLATTPEGRKNMSTLIPEDIRAVVQFVWAQVDRFLPPSSK